jgi:hypothetical protein
MPTPAPDGWLSEQVLISLTGVPRRRLVSWRQQDLIPRPERRFLGNHKGSVSYYPPVVLEAVRRLEILKIECRDVDEWRWRLWLEGFPSEIHKHLSDKVTGLVNLAKSVDNFDTLEGHLKGGIHPKRETAFRFLQDRVRKQPDRNTLFTWAASLGLGMDPPAALGDPSTPLFDILKRSVGLDGDWSAPNLPSFSIEALRMALSDSSDAERQQSRRDWTLIDGIVTALDRGASPRDAPTLIRFFLRLWKDFRTRSLLVGGLIALRREPDYSAGIDAGLGALSWLIDQSSVDGEGSSNAQ